METVSYTHLDVYKRQILGYVETLQDMNDEADAPTRNRFLAIIEREARRMQQLVIDLLSISRVEADRFLSLIHI